ncbi:MAG: hypothetical protein J7K98_00930 [Candidatus Aenigmarchaeota archaeon]|nr:hypothetical protein [Candidatus Aenigmarchaeota archaeon]
MEVLKPGKKDTISSDSSVQAVVETWDENIITFKVASRLASKIREGDIVLIDYSPISEKIVMPKMVIVKILRGEKGKKVWEVYKEFYRRKPKYRKLSSPPPQPQAQQKIKPQPTYVG